MSQLTVARLRCIGIGLYCFLLAGIGFLPALAAMVLGKILLRFGDLWFEECDATVKRCDAAKARLLKLEAKR